MATDLIRYDLLVQDAMRSVVRKVLGDVAASGYLPGDHHFTISFRTDAPGVKISRRLAEQWPQELTIILQHQFSNLEVDDEGFGVTLSFRSIPENLYVPFASITGFFDPSVEFGLRFEAADMEEDEEEEEDLPPGLRAVEEKVETKPAPASKQEKAEKIAAAAPPTPEGGESEGAAKVVSIDAFRKKT
ncbi:SspB family protein [Methylocystis sp.]|jgi:hypothetical protein|uniref:SspB family protein n=1 Tax=Methylocystis sp. TaxID=1911079 RepID=UPI002FAE1771